MNNECSVEQISVSYYDVYLFHKLSRTLGLYLFLIMTEILIIVAFCEISVTFE